MDESYPLCNVILSWMIKIWMKIHSISDCNCNVVSIYCPSFLLGIFLQEVTNIYRSTLSVGGITRAVYNQYWARQIEVVTLNTILSVVVCTLSNVMTTAVL